MNRFHKTISNLHAKLKSEISKVLNLSLNSIFQKVSHLKMKVLIFLYFLILIGKTQIHRM